MVIFSYLKAHVKFSLNNDYEGGVICRRLQKSMGYMKYWKIFCHIALNFTVCLHAQEQFRQGINATFS
jgi:hypothetical protein